MHRITNRGALSIQARTPRAIARTRRETTVAWALLASGWLHLLLLLLLAFSGRLRAARHLVPTVARGPIVIEPLARPPLPPIARAPTRPNLAPAARAAPASARDAGRAGDTAPDAPRDPKGLPPLSAAGSPDPRPATDPARVEAPAALPRPAVAFEKFVRTDDEASRASARHAAIAREDRAAKVEQRAPVTAVPPGARASDASPGARAAAARAQTTPVPARDATTRPVAEVNAKNRPDVAQRARTGSGAPAAGSRGAADVGPHAGLDEGRGDQGAASPPGAPGGEVAPHAGEGPPRLASDDRASAGVAGGGGRRDTTGDGAPERGPDASGDADTTPSGAATPPSRAGAAPAERAGGLPEGPDPDAAHPRPADGWSPRVVRLAEPAGATARAAPGRSATGTGPRDEGPSRAGGDRRTGPSPIRATARADVPSPTVGPPGTADDAPSPAQAPAPVAATPGTTGGIGAAHLTALPGGGSPGGTSDLVDELRDALGWGIIDRTALASPEASAGARPSPSSRLASPQVVTAQRSAFSDISYVDADGSAVGAWTDRIVTVLERRWYELDLPTRDRALGFEGRVTLLFRVYRSGRVEGLEVSVSSGVPGLDDLARSAIPERLPAAPAGVKLPSVVQQVTFTYENPLVASESR